MTDLREAEGEVEAVLPWHLRANWAPVHDELDVDGLEVLGALPPELQGTYVRNGMNPFTGRSAHWFFGHGMLHAVDLRDGRARYRNRFVRTPYLDHDGSGIDWVLDPACSPANTTVMAHGDGFLALEEQHLAYAVDRDLATIGVEDFGGVTGQFTAHPKRCPETGELLAFGYNPVGPTYLTYYRIGADGRLAQAEPITIPNPVMMHDFNITRDRVVFMDLPVRFGLDRAARGEEPFFFDPDAGARLGVLPRTGTDADVRWFEIDPCYVFHPLNAHDDGDRVVLTVCRLPKAMAGGFGDIGDKAVLWRWTIDLAAGTVREEQLDDRIADFPRVDDRRVGLPARYGYAAALGADPTQADLGSSIYRYDLTSGAVATHDCGPSFQVGEPVFAPRSPGAAEDDGWVLVLAHDNAENRTELRVLDAGDLAGAPVARVLLPRRVPYGAHGCWVADA